MAATNRYTFVVVVVLTEVAATPDDGPLVDAAVDVVGATAAVVVGGVVVGVTVVVVTVVVVADPAVIGAGALAFRGVVEATGMTWMFPSVSGSASMSGSSSETSPHAEGGGTGTVGSGRLAVFGFTVVAVAAPSVDDGPADAVLPGADDVVIGPDVVAPDVVAPDVGVHEVSGASGTGTVGSGILGTASSTTTPSTDAVGADEVVDDFAVRRFGTVVVVAFEEDGALPVDVEVGDQLGGIGPYGAVDTGTDGPLGTGVAVIVISNAVWTGPGRGAGMVVCPDICPDVGLVVEVTVAAGAVGALATPANEIDMVPAATTSDAAALARAKSMTRHTTLRLFASCARIVRGLCGVVRDVRCSAEPSFSLRPSVTGYASAP